MFKKVLSVILAVSMALSLCCGITFAAGIVISGGDTATNTVKGNAGDEITIPVNISGNTEGVTRFLIYLQYDADYLTPLAAEDEDMNPVGLVVDGTVGFPTLMANEKETYEGNPVVKVSGTSTRNIKKDGLLFGYKFKIKDTVAKRANTIVNIIIGSLQGLDGMTMNDRANTVNNATVKINPDLVVPVTVNLSDLTKTYNGAQQKAKVTLSDNTVSYKVTYNGSTSAPTNVGSYEVEATVTEEGYSGSKKDMFVINPEKISVKAEDASKYVGQSDPAEFVYTKTGGTFYGSDGFTGKLTRTAGETAGTYDITKGTLAVGSNYTLDFTKGTFTISAKKTQNASVSDIPANVTYGDAAFDFICTPDAASHLTTVTYKSSNPNVAAIDESGKVTIKAGGTTELSAEIAGNYEYENYVGKKTLTVARRDIAVKAKNVSVRMGSAEQPLEYEITSGTLVAGDSFAGAITREPGTAVGDYKIKQGTLALDSTKYNLTFTEGTYSIVDKTPQTVSVADFGAKTYGDAAFNVVVTPDAVSGLSSFTYESSNTSVATISDTGLITIVGAGTATIKVTEPGNADYAAAVVEKVLTVAKRDIAVKAKNVFVRVGSVEQPLEYEITSGTLVTGDSFAGAITREPGTAVGDYKIKQGTLALDSTKYNLTFTEGTYSIVDKTPQTVSVADFGAKTYGDAAFNVVVTPDAVSGLSSFTYESSNTSVATISDTGLITIVGAGTATIKVTEPGNADYAAAVVEKVLTVAKAPLSIAVNISGSSVYGEALPAVSAVYSGFVNGENESVIGGTLAYTGIPEGKVNAGTYTIAASGAESANYEITYTSADMTVAPRPIEIASFGVFGKEADGTKTATYNPAAFALAASREGFGILDGDDVTVEIIGTLEFDSAEAGDRTVTLNNENVKIDGADKANYVYAAPVPPLTASAKIFAAGTMTAQDVADMLANAMPVGQNETVLTLPVIPEGYSIEIISSSDTDVIGTDGSVSPKDTEQIIEVQFKITSKTNESDTATKTVSVTVPAVGKKTVTAVVLGGSGTIGGDAGEVNFNSTAVITATPANRYRISAWYVDGVQIVNEGNTYTFTVTDDVEIGVVFARTSGGGVVSVTPVGSSVSAPTSGTKTGSTVYKGTKITMASSTSGAKLYYTTDGTEPSEKNGALYTSDGIRISADTTVKAIAVKDGKSSTVSIFSYKVKTASAEFKKNASGIRYMATVSSSKFEPDRAATRYEVIDALGELMDIEDAKIENGFSDVDAKHVDIVNKFAATSIVDGYPNKTFGGTSGITRAEFAKMIVSALNLDISSEKAASFKDVESGHWAEKYIGAMARLGYVIGDPDGNFRPEDQVTRAEVVTVINRVIKVEAQKDIKPVYDDLLNEHWAYDGIMTVVKDSVNFAEK